MIFTIIYSSRRVCQALNFSERGWSNDRKDGNTESYARHRDMVPKPHEYIRLFSVNNEGIIIELCLISTAKT